MLKKIGFPNQPVVIALGSTIFFALLLSGCSKCDPVPAANSSVAPAASSQHGTLTVDATISTGTRFQVFANDNWKSPYVQPITPGTATSYRFDIPSSLTSLRLDLSELPDATVTVRKIKIELPGLSPRDLNLSDLPNWIKYHADVAYNPKDGTASVKSTGSYMYIMSIVFVNTMKTD